MESLVKYWNQHSKITLLSPDYDPDEVYEQSQDSEDQDLEINNNISEFEIPSEYNKRNEYIDQIISQKM